MRITALRLKPMTMRRLIAWVARTPVLDAVVARLGPRAGEVKSMTRGDLSWRMAFPPQRQDMDNLIPALIQWQGEGASSRLPDSHVRLLMLEAEHPDADPGRLGVHRRDRPAGPPADRRLRGVRRGGRGCGGGGRGRGCERERERSRDGDGGQGSGGAAVCEHVLSSQETEVTLNRPPEPPASARRGPRRSPGQP